MTTQPRSDWTLPPRPMDFATAVALLRAMADGFALAAKRAERRVLRSKPGDAGERVRIRACEDWDSARTNESAIRAVLAEIDAKGGAR